MALAVKSLKSHFPIFSNWPALVYLDSAATTQKPHSVIQGLTRFYEKENATVHRGLYELSAKATQRYEGVRKKVAELIGASANSIAFTKGTTESINIIAQSFLKKNLNAGDNVVISTMEHHANLIPWQQVCKQNNASLRIIPVNSAGELVMTELDNLLDNRTKMLAVTHISNALGTINPVEEIIFKAHKKNIPVLVDAAQSAGHYSIDVSKWDADFFAFSAHKMFGPPGTGVLYCKENLAQQVDAYNYGGGGIKNVSFEETEFLNFPYNLEAGTPNIAGVFGLGLAIDFIRQLDLTETGHHTKQLSSLFKEKLKILTHIHLVGNPNLFGSIVSFQVENIHPHDAAEFLAHSNIAVRAGHHCAQPLLESMGIHATIRASFSIYNTIEDVDRTIEALIELKRFWS